MQKILIRKKHTLLSEMLCKTFRQNRSNYVRFQHIAKANHTEQKANNDLLVHTYSTNEIAIKIRTKPTPHLHKGT